MILNWYLTVASVFNPKVLIPWTHSSSFLAAWPPLACNFWPLVIAPFFSHLFFKSIIFPKSNFVNNFSNPYLFPNDFSISSCFKIISNHQIFPSLEFLDTKIPFSIKFGCHFPSGKPLLHFSSFLKCFKISKNKIPWFSSNEIYGIDLCKINGLWWGPYICDFMIDLLIDWFISYMWLIYSVPWYTHYPSVFVH